MVNLEDCLSGITEMTRDNRLKLNNDVTQFIVLTRGQKHQITSADIGVDGIRVKATDNAKYVAFGLTPH